VKIFKKAFTMIELVFVIVILGILSAVAFPKLSGVLEDANYASALATISSLRTAITNERQNNLIKGSAAFHSF
jgi:general secretion pathway protein G